MAEKDRFIKSENKRICFYIPPEDKKALEMIAAKENRTVSAVVRSAVEKYMVTDSYENNLELINGIVNNSVEIQIKKLGNRLAGLINRLTIISAAGYFTNISVVAELLDRDRYSSFEKIEKIARRKALLYANTKSFDGLEGFLDDEKIRQIQCEMVSKEYNSADSGYFDSDTFDYTDFDY